MSSTGTPIKELTQDLVLNLTDTVVGTDEATGNSYKFTVQQFIDKVEAAAGGISNSDNVYTIQEGASTEYWEELNDLTSPWSINPADIPYLIVNDSSGDYKETRIYKKSSTGTIRIGRGETQVASVDFFLIQQVEGGEANTIGDVSGITGESVASGKVGVELQTKGIKSSDSSLTVTSDANDVDIILNGSLGESNTIADAAGSVGESIVDGKYVEQLRVKGILVEGGTVSSDANDVTIGVGGKVKETASFTVSSATHNFKTIYLKNGASAAVVTIPHDLPLNFECTMIVRGTGVVTFTTSGGATINQSELTAKGENATIWIGTDLEDVTVIDVLGDTKV